MRIREPEWKNFGSWMEKVGSGIRDKHPRLRNTDRHTTVKYRKHTQQYIYHQHQFYAKYHILKYHKITYGTIGIYYTWYVRRTVC
jgi:hypothetical protein